MNETPIQIVGNLTADPELRHTNNETPVANLRVASNPRRFDRQSGKWVDGTTSYFDVEVWYGQAVNVVQSLTQGDRVIIFGTIRTKSWQPEEGPRRSKQVVVATEIGPSLRYATAEPVKADRDDAEPEGEEPTF